MSFASYSPLRRYVKPTVLGKQASWCLGHSKTIIGGAFESKGREMIFDEKEHYIF